MYTAGLSLSRVLLKVYIGLCEMEAPTYFQIAVDLHMQT